jgi:predicted nucleic acid-binding protein
VSTIANTTVLSNFARIRQLALLRSLYGVLYISAEVYTEVQDGLDEGYAFYTGIEQLVYPLAADGWIHLTSMTDTEELRLFAAMPRGLHQGEASSLAIAAQRGWTLLTDDRAARREAARLGIRLSGSVGCLVLGVEQGHCTLDTANDWLHTMIQQGYYAPTSDLTPLVARSQPPDEDTQEGSDA